MHQPLTCCLHPRVVAKAIILSPWGWRQESQEPRVIFSYLVSSRLAWATGDTISKTANNSQMTSSSHSVFSIRAGAETQGTLGGQECALTVEESSELPCRDTCARASRMCVTAALFLLTAGRGSSAGEGLPVILGCVHLQKAG